MASAAIKRQRKRRRIDTDGDPEFQVAPMVDVLLVLMLFFMAITSTEVLKKDKNLQLADAKHAKPQESKTHKDEIVVNISWNGIESTPGYTMNGLSFTGPGEMQAELAKEHNARPNAPVVIRADRDVQYSNVADMMKTCGEAGIGTVTFAVLIGGDDKKKAGGDAPANP